MEESDIQKDKVLEANKRIEQLASYLGIPKQDIILAINPVNEINLGGNIQRNNVYEVKVQGKNKKTYSRSARLSHGRRRGRYSRHPRRRDASGSRIGRGSRRLHAALHSTIFY